MAEQEPKSAHEAFFSDADERGIIASVLQTSHAPKAELSSSPHTIDILTDRNEFIDLDTIRITGKAHIRKFLKNGTQSHITDATKVNIVNYFPSTLWKSVDIFLNHKKVSDSSDLYHYKSYLETLLTGSYGQKNHNLQNAIWFDDSPGCTENFDETKNPNGHARAALAKSHFDFSVPVHGDIFRTVKYLPDMMRMKFQMQRNKDSLSLIYNDTDDTNVDYYEIVLDRLEVIVQRISLLDNAYQSYVEKFKSNPIILKFPRVNLMSRVYTLNNREIRIHEAISGQVPVKSFLFFVDTERYNGAKDKSPFKFEHCNLESCHVVVKGKRIPNVPYYFEMEKNLYGEAYQGLIDCLGVGFFGYDIGLSKQKYKEDCFIIGFDIPNDSNLGVQDHPYDIGTVDLFMNFSKTDPSKMINVLLYNQYESVLTIDANREVHQDSY